ncbi:MAG: WYL domain-containing protein [Verrucomicrobia bacterium]|nr:WYL domain-containing protein [Cytophagales bacterium]
MLARESELQDYHFAVSKRTFKRDLDEIRSVYDLDIQYDFSRKVYHIIEDQTPAVQQRLSETFDMLNVLRVSENLSRYIHFETRKAQGSQHFLALLQAVKKQQLVWFSYQKFWEDEPVERTVAPFGLKEFKGRWYLIARDAYDQRTKIYGLDSLLEVEVLKQKYTVETAFDMEAYFEDCFGIIRPESGEVPQEIILSFTPFQGKYIKSYPLHPSQQIILETQTEIRFQLKLYVTYDFVQELLSFGETLEIISPAGLN